MGKERAVPKPRHFKNLIWTALTWGRSRTLSRISCPASPPRQPSARFLERESDPQTGWQLIHRGCCERQAADMIGPPFPFRGDGGQEMLDRRNNSEANLRAGAKRSRQTEAQFNGHTCLGVR